MKNFDAKIIVLADNYYLNVFNKKKLTSKERKKSWALESFNKARVINKTKIQPRSIFKLYPYRLMEKN